jgi:hypothetical protein
VVSIVEANAADATVVAGSQTSDVFCARTDGTDATYGSAGPDRDMVVTDGSVRRAVMACGSRAFTTAAVRMFDVAGMCDGVDDQAVLICRAVQRRVVEPTLASPTLADRPSVP